MNFKLHNKIEILSNGKNYVFYNTMLKSVCSKYTNLQKFNSNIALGTGTTYQNNFKLSNHIKSYLLTDDYLQDDASTGNDIFIKKTVIIDDYNLDNTYLTEAGITDTLNSDPVVFNYFSLISDNSPNGIKKEVGKPLTISIYIYLTLTKSGDGFVTAGSNKFIDFLLGNGIDGKIYACKGKNLVDNTNFINRDTPRNAEKVECQLISIQNESSFNLTFSANLGTGKTNEIVFLINDSPFARINVLDYKTATSSVFSANSGSSDSIILGEDIKSIDSVKENDELVTNTSSVRYATDFGDKISLPFHGLFDNNTPRFLSKDGKMIFFVKDNKIYGYINSNYGLVQINTTRVYIENILNIISFDKYVFIISKSAPYIISYIIENNEFIKCKISFNTFDENSLIEKLYKVDITYENIQNFMIGFIEETNHYGYVLYYRFDRVNKSFYLNSYLSSSYYYTNILAVYKNNFSTPVIMLLKGDTTEYNNRITYFYADKTSNEIFSTEAKNILSSNKEIYVKNRALITEKNYSPKIEMYLFPNKNKITISLEENEENDYFSSNLLYLIQKANNEYKIYSLSNLTSPTEFDNGLPSEINQSKILDFEFLDDILLIFMDNKAEPILAYSFFDNKLIAQNVTNNSSYEFSLQKYNLIGQNNEGVKTTFVVSINI